MPPLVRQGTIPLLAGQVDAHVGRAIMSRITPYAARAELEPKTAVQRNRPRRNPQQMGQIQKRIIRRIQLGLTFRTAHPIPVSNPVNAKRFHQHRVIHILPVAVIFPHPFRTHLKHDIRLPGNSSQLLLELVHVRIHIFPRLLPGSQAILELNARAAGQIPANKILALLRSAVVITNRQLHVLPLLFALSVLPFLLLRFMIKSRLHSRRHAESFNRLLLGIIHADVAIT